MAIPAKSIDEVLSELDRIIKSTLTANNFLGIFAYVYYRTTAQIKQSIQEKQFEDNERMERLDVAFANLYLSAYQDYMNLLSCPGSWKIAFDAKSDTLSIIQHIMLGMNAHINLDLGMAAARFQSGTNIYDLKNDFMKVNQILNSLVNEMQDRIGKVSRLMILLDWIGQNSDEFIIDFSMAKAREEAWEFACRFDELPENERDSAFHSKDRLISDLGGIIRNPPGLLLKIILRIISRFEDKNVKTIINKLTAQQV